MTFKGILVFALLLFLTSLSKAQDTIQKKDKDLTFTGTKINPYAEEYDSTGKIEFSGYVDCYYANYTDSAGPGGYQKMPTVAPRSNMMGLNIAQFSVKYTASRFRATGTLFYGDCAKSAWSPNFNMIQEANAGFRIAKKLWFDAGFFRTYIGLESIQPRENIAMSFAAATYFEPYYMSGAKLTWEASSKLTLQVNAFNGFNNFVDNNQNKTVGLSLAYTPIKQLSVTLNTIVCDESATGAPIKQQRNYNNLYLVYKTNRLTVGFEFNYGMQQHSVIMDSTQTAYMMSTLLAVKYRMTSKFAAYTRGEYFQDDDGMLSGPVLDDNHQLHGLDIYGYTVGFEYKPIANSYLRVEGRQLFTEPHEKIFYYNNTSTNQRLELIIGMGVWF